MTHTLLKSDEINSEFIIKAIKKVNKHIPKGDYFECCLDGSTHASKGQAYVRENFRNNLKYRSKFYIFNGVYSNDIIALYDTKKGLIMGNKNQQTKTKQEVIIEISLPNETEMNKSNFKKRFNRIFNSVEYLTLLYAISFIFQIFIIKNEHLSVILITSIFFLIFSYIMTKILIQEHTSIKPRILSPIHTFRKYKYYKRLLSKAYNNLNRASGRYIDDEDEVYEYMLESYIGDYEKTNNIKLHTFK